MNFIGIDDWKKDSLIGIIIGIAFIIASSITALSIFVPSVKTSISSYGNFFIIVIGSPFFEELLFRGIGLSILASKFNAAIAVVAQSVAFMLFHLFAYTLGFYQSFGSVLMAFAGAGIAGVLFGILALKTDNILPPIIVHAMMNFWLTKQMWGL